MMKPKYLLFSAALLAMTQAVALTPVRKQTQMPAAKKQVNKATLSVADKDAPAYTIVGKDSTCQIFVYSPAPNQGLHLAYLTDDERDPDSDNDFGKNIIPKMLVDGEITVLEIVKEINANIESY